MKYKISKIENMSLISQLSFLTLTALIISLLFFDIILKSILLPFYEENTYNYLKQPAGYIKINSNKVGKDVAFIIETEGGAKIISNNFSLLFQSVSVDKILSEVDGVQGKFDIDGNTYYYVVGDTEDTDIKRNILFTDDRMVVTQKASLKRIILPTMVLTMVIVTAILFTWSKYIVKKINILKKKTENIDNDNYIHDQEFKEFLIDDELNLLNLSIEKTRKNLKAKEEYKNLMFQNLSHELKTPISVIKSYIEGVQDGVVSEKEAVPIILEETNRLNEQVKTLLHFNKIDYMKERFSYKNSNIDLVPLVENSIKKHKLQRKDVEWTLHLQENLQEFKGTADMWQKIIDNILNNFERYTKSKIAITIKNDYVEFENDGEKIPKDLLDNIFLPYTKGPKGQSGLGLGVVKSTANLFSYDVKAENRENTVAFIIYKTESEDKNIRNNNDNKRVKK